MLPHGMIGVCIPTVDRPTLKEAVVSVERLPGHVPFLALDNGHGANETRNRALALALDDTRITHVRFLDDDDVLLAAVPLLDKAFVYFPIERPDGSVSRVVSDPWLQIFVETYPVFWQARADVLRSLHKEKPLWDTTKPCRQGSWFWLKLLQRMNDTNMIGLKDRPYYRYTAPGLVSKHPDFGVQSSNFFAEVFRTLPPEKAALRLDWLRRATPHGVGLLREPD